LSWTYINSTMIPLCPSKGTEYSPNRGLARCRPWHRPPHNPPARTLARYPRCASKKAAAELRRSLWQYSTYSRSWFNTPSALRISDKGMLIAPASLSYWNSEGKRTSTHCAPAATRCLAASNEMRRNSGLRLPLKNVVLSRV
jgi:hypothetical protein